MEVERAEHQRRGSLNPIAPCTVAMPSAGRSPSDSTISGQMPSGRRKSLVRAIGPRFPLAVRQFAGRVVFDAELRLKRVEHLQCARQFLLGEQADLQVQSAAVRIPRFNGSL